ncbi:MAG: signal peptide peptidase SppA [Sedimentisphaerales bacterium]|nr:signal peptide peptidase SppA [Sedimentisphaerales bacterium]
MDFEHNNKSNEPGPLPPQQPGEYLSRPYGPPEPPKKKSGWKIFWGISLGLSVLGNIVFFLMIVGLLAFLVTGQTDIMTEKVVVTGDSSKKIAVIKINGIIDSTTAKDIIEQLQHAWQDNRVKAVILSVDSPGGTISGSDRIYNEIINYRDMTGKPVIAFMRNLAASGGYYVSVASDEIVAEPTVITGSIGVIMGYLVVEELLEDKLGIQPVIIKSGEKKDWPNSFQKPSEEQLAYLDKKVIQPAFERFTQIVADGRSELSMDDVMRLSDGSIYSADEALNEKMIDEIGYFEDAVSAAEELAGIKNAQVVEYKRPFSLGSLLGAEARSIFKLDRKTLYELATPEVMYLWSVH